MREIFFADTFFYGGYLTRILQDYGQLVNSELPGSIISENYHILSINTNIFNISARLQINDHLSLNGIGSLMFRRSDYDLKYR